MATATAPAQPAVTPQAGRSVENPLRAVGRALLIPPIRFYRRFISPALPPACRYIPSCSQYAIEAIDLHGPVKGSWLATRRICRCHPWGGHGWDPVPGSPDAGDGVPVAGSQEEGKRGGRGRSDRARSSGLLLAAAMGLALATGCAERRTAVTLLQDLPADEPVIGSIVRPITRWRLMAVDADRVGLRYEYHGAYHPKHRDFTLDRRGVLLHAGMQVGDPVQITPLPDGGLVIGR